MDAQIFTDQVEPRCFMARAANWTLQRRRQLAVADAKLQTIRAGFIAAETAVMPSRETLNTLGTAA